MKRHHAPSAPSSSQPCSLVAPGEVVDYLLDVYPVGHVFLPGHELVVKISAPPADDNG